AHVGADRGHTELGFQPGQVLQEVIQLLTPTEN
ncbi:MAG: hypothetical protein RL442_2880, partial [Pseudomonadota bacterium]